MFNIKAIDQSNVEAIQSRIDNKTKPKGSLGQLENLALQLAQIIGDENLNASEKRLSLVDPIQINQPVMLVFAGDHGIAKENVSIAPSEVTQQMVLNFLDGGAAINCFCRTNDMTLEVVDAGILLPIDDGRLTIQSLGNGTNNIVSQSAMSKEQVKAGLAFGQSLVEKHLKYGTNVFGFGEMGIGNTSSAAAIQSVVTNQPIENCVGRGTGIDDETLARKIKLLRQSIEYHRERLAEKLSDPMEILSAFGGFEIVQMIGAMLCAAENETIILVDGYIATAAALLAIELHSESRGYMVFCHQSEEQGHQLMLKHLSAKPLLSLGLRLGEGTGAALAMPLVRAAASFYNDMASFESAGVTAV